MSRISLLIFMCILILSCQDSNPNKQTRTTTEIQHVERDVLERDSVASHRKVYVPVYSNIYQRSRNDRVLLTSTLSIHNTSDTDTLYISKIDYFDTQGNLVRSYLENDIYLTTFETIEFVVDEKDDSGGSGANFFIEWYGSDNLNPIFQGVMVGGLGNKSFSFVTEGVDVVKNKNAE